MKHNYDILVTSDLTQDQIDYAEDLGLNVEIDPAIEIEFREDWFMIETLFRTNKNPVFAFTSQNGVKALEMFRELGGKIPKNPTVYAVGKRTALALSEMGFKSIIPEQQNGIGLAKKIAEDLSEYKKSDRPTVLHFCGDKRRDEFRQFLDDSDIHVRDLVVYNTHLNSMRLPTQKIDGILFYSPSAVHAFRNSGGFINKNLPELFAIGNTTAEDLSIESGKHVHVSPEPSTEDFLEFVAKILKEENPKVVT